jgi:hypothetical protein
VADVRPRKGGPYSLYCYDCKRWIPNTANHEMQKEGAYAHSHFCFRGKNGKIEIYWEQGIKDEGEQDGQSKPD